MSEYEMLREEIMQKYRIIAGYNTAIFTSYAAIFAFVWNTDNPFAFLLPLAVVVPLFLISEQEHYLICNIAAYLYVFKEGNDYNWERLNYYNIKIGNKKEIRSWRRVIPHYVLIIICGIISISRVYDNHSINYFKMILIILICVICLIVLSVNTVDYTKAYSHYLKKWNNIKNKN